MRGTCDTYEPIDHANSGGWTRRREKENLDVSQVALEGNENLRKVYIGLMFESSAESACEHSKDEGGNVNFHLMSLKQILLRKLGWSFYGHVMVINSRTRANTEIQMNLSSDFEIRYFFTENSAWNKF